MTYICRCDAEGCTEEYIFGDNHSEEVLVRSGWSVLTTSNIDGYGGHRNYHFCPNHRYRFREPVIRADDW